MRPQPQPRGERNDAFGPFAVAVLWDCGHIDEGIGREVRPQFLCQLAGASPCIVYVLIVVEVAILPRPPVLESISVDVYGVV